MPQDLTPLGELIERARNAAGLSKRAAARRADISEGRWRQVVTGVVKIGGGATTPARPRLVTVAAMARAVGVDEREAVKLAGYDPAEVLRPEDAGQADPDIRAILESDLPEEEKAELVEYVQRERRESSARIEERIGAAKRSWQRRRHSE